MTALEKRNLYMKVYNENKQEVDARIKDGIEKKRKGNCQIRFTNSNGEKIVGKKIKVTQKNHEFNYGANIFMLDEFDNEDYNKKYRRFFKEYFNTATVPFYWDALEPVEGNPRYDKDSEKIYRRPAPDLCMNYCEENGINPKLHCLVYEHFMPEWMGKLSLTEVKKKYEERFRQISERYSGRMLEFEVINEVLCEWHDSALGYEKDIIEWAFELAKKYFPNETLVINEGANKLTDMGCCYKYGGLYGYRTPYLLQLDCLLAKGVQIDKIGIQNHLFTGVNAHTPEEYDASVLEGVDINNPFSYFKGLDMLAEFGLPIEITEVTVPTFGDTEEDEELQADILKLWYSIWFSHPAVDTVVYWNTVDGYAFILDDWNENNCRGGLFHKDLTPKKSAIMLKNLFTKEWHTEEEITTDKDGYIDFRGFYGDYIIEFENNGEIITKEISLKKQNNNKFEFTI